MRSNLLVPCVLALSVGLGGCPDGGVDIDLAEGEGEAGGEGEGERPAPIAATNDTCATAIVLSDAVLFRMPAFTATASLRNCSATNAAGDDGIDDVAFSFVTTAVSDVVVTADGASGAFGDDSYVSPTLTLFDSPGCAFPDVHTVDDRTCVGDGLTFDGPTVMSVTELPAGTWYLVAETFGDLSPFDIRVDVF